MRNDNALVQAVSKVMTARFNRANLTFASQGQDATKELMKLSSEHGIAWDLSSWPWSKPPEAYRSVNDFFMRRLAVEIVGGMELVSPVTAVGEEPENRSVRVTPLLLPTPPPILTS